LNFDPCSTPSAQSFRTFDLNEYCPLCRVIVIILGYGERLAKYTACDPEAASWKRVFTTSLLPPAADVIRHIRHEGSLGIEKAVTTAMGN
jgi:hypothetical protein